MKGPRGNGARSGKILLDILAKSHMNGETWRPWLEAGQCVPGEQSLVKFSNRAMDEAGSSNSSRLSGSPTLRLKAAIALGGTTFIHTANQTRSTSLGACSMSSCSVLHPLVNATSTTLLTTLYSISGVVLVGTTPRRSACWDSSPHRGGATPLRTQRRATRTSWHKLGCRLLHLFLPTGTQTRTAQRVQKGGGVRCSTNECLPMKRNSALQASSATWYPNRFR